ncbi:MAG: NUDIX domain-containing protein [Pseudobdellovibrionaceae bacterium]
MVRVIEFFYKLQRIYWKIRKPLTMGTRVIVEKEDSILLVQMTYMRGWFLPGGGVDKGETFYTSAKRELQEECGLEASDLKLLGVYLNRKHGKVDHVAVYLAPPPGSDPSIQDPREIRAVRYFHKNELPADLAPGHRRRIEEFYGLRDLDHHW